MLSAVVILPSQPVRASGRTASESIVRTLASLVPAAVEGILRDVTIAAALDDADLERIEDHAGCELVQETGRRDALVRALGQTRESNIFLIRAGRAPEAGFGEEIAEFLGDGHRLARMRERPGSFLTRLMPGLSPASALLAPRDSLIAIASDDLLQMSRRLGSAQTLRSRARWVD